MDKSMDSPFSRTSEIHTLSDDDYSKDTSSEDSSYEDDPYSETISKLDNEINKQNCNRKSVKNLFNPLPKKRQEAYFFTTFYWAATSDDANFKQLSKALPINTRVRMLLAIHPKSPTLRTFFYKQIKNTLSQLIKTADFKTAELILNPSLFKNRIDSDKQINLLGDACAQIVKKSKGYIEGGHTRIFSSLCQLINSDEEIAKQLDLTSHIKTLTENNRYNSWNLIKSLADAITNRSILESFKDGFVYALEMALKEIGSNQNSVSLSEANSAQAVLAILNCYKRLGIKDPSFTTFKRHGELQTSLLEAVVNAAEEKELADSYMGHNDQQFFKEITSLLLDSGANPNHKPPYPNGQAPLVFAINHYIPYVVDALLESSTLTVKTLKESLTLIENFSLTNLRQTYRQKIFTLLLKTRQQEYGKWFASLSEDEQYSIFYNKLNVTHQNPKKRELNNLTATLSTPVLASMMLLTTEKLGKNQEPMLKTLYKNSNSEAFTQALFQELSKNNSDSDTTIKFFRYANDMQKAEVLFQAAKQANNGKFFVNFYQQLESSICDSHQSIHEQDRMKTLTRHLHPNLSEAFMRALLKNNKIAITALSDKLSLTQLKKAFEKAVQEENASAVELILESGAFDIFELSVIAKILQHAFGELIPPEDKSDSAYSIKQPVFACLCKYINSHPHIAVKMDEFPELMAILESYKHWEYIAILTTNIDNKQVLNHLKEEFVSALKEAIANYQFDTALAILNCDKRCNIKDSSFTLIFADDWKTASVILKTLVKIANSLKASNHYSRHQAQLKQITEQLLRLGANPNQLNAENNQSIFSMAIDKKLEDVIDCILSSIEDNQKYPNPLDLTTLEKGWKALLQDFDLSNQFGPRINNFLQKSRSDKREKRETTAKFSPNQTKEKLLKAIKKDKAAVESVLENSEFINLKYSETASILTAAFLQISKQAKGNAPSADQRSIFKTLSKWANSYEDITEKMKWDTILEKLHKHWNWEYIKTLATDIKLKAVIENAKFRFTYTLDQAIDNGKYDTALELLKCFQHLKITDCTFVYNAGATYPYSFILADLADYVIEDATTEPEKEKLKQIINLLLILSADPNKATPEKGCSVLSSVIRENSAYAVECILCPEISYPVALTASTLKYAKKDLQESSLSNRQEYIELIDRLSGAPSNNTTTTRASPPTTTIAAVNSPAPAAAQFFKPVIEDKQEKVKDSRLLKTLKGLRTNAKLTNEDKIDTLKKHGFKCDKPPKGFDCGITFTLMNKPASGKCCHTYEKAALKKWIDNRATCPRDQQSLQKSDLIVNIALKRIIDDWVDGQIEKAIESLLKAEKNNTTGNDNRHGSETAYFG